MVTDGPVLIYIGNISELSPQPTDEMCFIFAEMLCSTKDKVFVVIQDPDTRLETFH